MKKEKQLDIGESAFGKSKDAFVSECMGILTEHRERYHNDGSGPCVVCRSLRRNILKGLGQGQ